MLADAPVPTGDEELLTYDEAARAEGITRTAITQAVQRGSLRFIVVNGRRYIRRSDLTAYRQRRRYLPTALALRDNPLDAYTDMQDLTAGAAPSDLLRLQTLGQMFSGIAGNVAREARIATQPQVDGAALQAAMQLLLHGIQSRFQALIGPEIFDRMARGETMTERDKDAVMLAFTQIMLSGFDTAPTSAQQAEVQDLSQRVRKLADSAEGVDSDDKARRKLAGY